MTLYEINEALMACVDQETGEIIDVEALNALHMEREKKLENVALWVKDLRAEADAIANEIKALTARKKAAENKADRLKAWLGEALEGEVFKTSKVRISYTHNTRLNVPDERELVEFLKTLEEPEKFLRFSDPELRKDEIKKALKDGYIIPGAELEATESVVIK